MSPENERDELFQLLSHQYRRQMFKFLDDQPSNTATIDELVTHIDPVSDGSSLRMELYHVHLPKLDESTLVEWDSQSEIIQYYPSDLSGELVHLLREHTPQSANA